MEEQIKQWLETAISWQESKTLSHLCRQQHHLPGLTTFLVSLVEKLNTMVDVEEALVQLPDVGQLLGRLCGIAVVLGDQQAYTALMKCVLWFSVEEPKTPVEVKAKSWALAQVRSTVCRTGEQLASRTLTATGFQQHHLNQMCLLQQHARIKEESQFSSREWESSLQCLVPVRKQPKPAQLTALCEACMLTVQQPQLAGLQKHFLQQITLAGGATSENQKFYQHLDELEHHCASQHKGTGKLSYGAKVVLWQTHLPILENEVLLLVRQTVLTPCGSRKRWQDWLHSRHIALACAENFQIYYTVFSMLHSILKQCNGDTRLAQLIACLHHSVRQCARESKHVYRPIMCLYPRAVWPLVNLLQVPPDELTQETACHQVQMLSDWLDSYPVRSNERTCDAVWLVLLHHYHWYHATLQLALLGDRQSVKACSNLLAHVHETTTASIMHTRRRVEETILSLRGLLAKTHLETSDIQCATLTSLDTSGSQATSGQTFLSQSPSGSHTVIGQLLCVFLLCSHAGLSIAENLLHVACKSNRVDEQLNCLLDTLEFMDHGAKFYIFTCEKVDHLTRLIENMAGKVRTGSSEPMDISGGQIDVSSGQINTETDAPGDTGDKNQFDSTALLIDNSDKDFCNQLLEKTKAIVSSLNIFTK